MVISGLAWERCKRKQHSSSIRLLKSSTARRDPQRMGKRTGFEKRDELRSTPNSVQYVNTNKQLIDRAPKTENENVGFSTTSGTAVYGVSGALVSSGTRTYGRGRSLNGVNGIRPLDFSTQKLDRMV